MNGNHKPNNIGDRIKCIRKSLNMSQEEFGKPLGVTKAAISTYENNLRTPSSRVALLISYCYNINIDYLKDGRGCMHTDISDTYLNTIVSEYNLDPTSQNIIGKYLGFTIKERTTFNKYLVNLVTLMCPDVETGTDKMK